MRHSLRTDPTLALKVSAQLCTGAELLRMTNDEMARHLTREAARNPFLRVSAGVSPVSPGENMVGQGESLHAAVLRQVFSTFAEADEIRAAVALTEALDPTGWLGRPVERIAAEVGQPVEAVAAVLLRCQGFEPTGLFARDLAECLSLQLAERGNLTAAADAVIGNLAAMLDGGVEALADLAGLDMGAVEDVLADIRRCDPKPGTAFAPQDLTLDRQPDILVERAGDGWRIELNRSSLPRVSLSESGSSDDPALRHLTSAAHALAGAVDRRNRMTLGVARAVIGHQVAFLEHGVSGLRPLRRRDVAERMEIHESTVSRVVQGLLVQTPCAALELCRFFSRPVGSGSEGAEARRHLIERLRVLIASESPSAPFTDSELASRLAENGARISRRTVAKYRQRLDLPGAPARLKAAKTA